MKQPFKSPASSIRNNRLIDLAHSPPASPCSPPEGLNVITAGRVLFFVVFFPAFDSILKIHAMSTLAIFAHERFRSKGSESKFHAVAICLYYVPLSFPFDSAVSALLGAALGKSNSIKTLWEGKVDRGAFLSPGRVARGVVLAIKHS